MNFDPVLDQMLFAYCQLERRMAIKDIQAAHPSRWDIHLIEAKCCDDTWPERQLARATEQLIRQQQQSWVA